MDTGFRLALYLVVVGFISFLLFTKIGVGAEDVQTKIECHQLVPLFQFVAVLGPYVEGDSEIGKVLDDIYRECRFTPEDFITAGR